MGHYVEEKASVKKTRKRLLHHLGDNQDEAPARQISNGKGDFPSEERLSVPGLGLLCGSGGWGNGTALREDLFSGSLRGVIRSC